MPRTVSTGSTSIEFGSSLRIGYRPMGSTGPYKYITPYPDYNSLPFSFQLEAGTWEFELTMICPSCSGGIYSNPEITQITVPNG